MLEVLLDLLKALVIDHKMLLICFFLDPAETVVYLLHVRNSYRACFPRSSPFPVTHFGQTSLSLVETCRCDCGQLGCGITGTLVILNSLSHCIQAESSKFMLWEKERVDILD